MRAIIRTFLVFSLMFVFVVSSSYAQNSGVRVEADIPFDFSIGDKTFAAGKYGLSLIRLSGPVYSVTLRDDAGKLVQIATAIRNGSSIPNKSDMLFAIVEDQHHLDKIRTPECGFTFNKSSGNKTVAKAKRVSVPTTGTSPNF